MRRNQWRKEVDELEDQEIEDIMVYGSDSSNAENQEPHVDMEELTKHASSKIVNF